NEAAHIQLACVLVLKQQARNQKSAEDKEQVDTDPACLSPQREVIKVPSQNQQDGDAAQHVKRLIAGIHVSAFQLGEGSRTSPQDTPLSQVINRSDTTRRQVF